MLRALLANDVVSCGHKWKNPESRAFRIFWGELAEKMPPWKWLKSLYYKDFQDFWQLFYSRFDSWWRYFAKSKFLRKRWRWPLKLLQKRCIRNLLSLQFYYSLIYCISNITFGDFLLLHTKTSNWIPPTNDVSWLWIGVLCFHKAHGYAVRSLK